MTNDARDTHLATHDLAEAPELVLIGEAHAVVLGTPYGGFDGNDCITFADFEFQKDEI